MIEFVHSGNVRTAKPLFELAWVGALLFAWTGQFVPSQVEVLLIDVTYYIGANIFSTSRWSSVRPSDCASIPVGTRNPQPLLKFHLHVLQREMLTSSLP